MKRARLLRRALLTLVAVAIVHAGGTQAASDPAQPYIVLFADAAVAEPGAAVTGTRLSATAGLLASGAPAVAQRGRGDRPRIDGQRVSQRVERLRQRGKFNESHVFASAVGGFAAQLTGAQRRAVEADPAVEAVVRDELVRLDTALAADGAATANVVNLASPQLPAGITRVGATQSPVARIDGTDQRVDVDVAIIDTGLEADHPDLNVAGGYNCTGSNRGNFADGYGHGTHVGGTVGALDNGIGVVGVAPGARLWGVKVLDATGSGSLSWILCGVDWVTAQRDSSGARIEVVNMSLRMTLSGADDRDCGYPAADALHKAICRSVEAGTTYVVAAGNDKRDARVYRPAAYDEAITVSAFTDYDGRPGGLGKRPTACSSGFPDDAFAGFSNYGADVSLTAPGVCVLSTWKDRAYAYASGTSMSAPHVAGGAALYLAQYPAARPQQVRMALEHAARHDWKTATDPDGRPERNLWVDGFLPPPDFTLNSSLPSGYLGTSAMSISATLKRTNGHSAPVSFSVSGLPAGATASSTTTSGSSATVTLRAASGTPAGRYSVALRATDGELVRSRAFELLIDAEPPAASFDRPADGTLTMQSSKVVSVAWSESDGAGSGVKSRSVQRQRGVPRTPGSCADAVFSNVGTARTSRAAFSETLNSGYCFRYRLVISDNAGNSAVHHSGTVLIDASGPSTPSVTLTGSSSGLSLPAGAEFAAAHQSGSAVWFRSGGAGSLELGISASDAQSGISHATLEPSVTSGWNSVPAIAGGDTPVTLSFARGALASWITVRAVNGAGVAGSATTLALYPDSTAPSSATWSAPASGKTVHSSGSTTIAWTGGADHGAGLATAHFVRRERALLSAAGSCGSWSLEGPGLVASSGTVVSDLLDGYCYRWRLRTADRVGNLAAVVRSGTVVVAPAPAAPSPSATPAPTPAPGTGAPMVSGLAAVPAETKVTTSGGVRTQVTWSTDGPADRHELRLSKDGGTTWKAVALADPTSPRHLLTLARGGRYTVSVRSRNGSSWGAWAASAPFSVGLVQENDNSVTYSGAWQNVALTNASGGRLSYSKQAGASARMVFVGRSIALVSMTAARRGRAQVYLDGKLAATVDLRAAKDKRVIVFSHNWAKVGTHTIEVRLLDMPARPRVDVDAFVVFGT